MSVLSYPTGYELPKKNVLVLSCMDLRLTDNLVNFLHFDNLANRYDHFILAGTSLGVRAQCNFSHFKVNVDRFKKYRDSFFEHLQLAIDLHHVKDLYIIEHQDCGAYKSFLEKGKPFSDEIECHKYFALNLADEIHNTVRYDFEYRENNRRITKKPYLLGVHCFYIDLQGNVELLGSLTAKELTHEYLEITASKSVDSSCAD